MHAVAIKRQFQQAIPHAPPGLLQTPWLPSHIDILSVVAIAYPTTRLLLSLRPQASQILGYIHKLKWVLNPIVSLYTINDFKSHIVAFYSDTKCVYKWTIPKKRATFQVSFDAQPDETRPKEPDEESTYVQVAWHCAETLRQSTHKGVQSISKAMHAEVDKLHSYVPHLIPP